MRSGDTTGRASRIVIEGVRGGVCSPFLVATAGVRFFWRASGFDAGTDRIKTISSSSSLVSLLTGLGRCCCEIADRLCERSLRSGGGRDRLGPAPLEAVLRMFWSRSRGWLRETAAGGCRMGTDTAAGSASTISPRVIRNGSKLMTI